MGEICPPLIMLKREKKKEEEEERWINGNNKHVSAHSMKN